MFWLLEKGFVRVVWVFIFQKITNNLYRRIKNIFLTRKKIFVDIPVEEIKLKKDPPLILIEGWDEKKVLLEKYGFSIVAKQDFEEFML